MYAGGGGGGGRGRLGVFIRQENNVPWLAPSKIFQKKGGGGGVRFFGVCAVKRRNTVPTRRLTGFIIRISTYGWKPLIRDVYCSEVPVF